VEVGSWHKPNKIPYEKRYCFYCQDDIEDEFHFVLCCPIYKDVRVKYIKKYYRCKPSMFKFIQLCKSESKRELILLGKHITECFQIRDQHVCQF